MSIRQTVMSWIIQVSRYTSFVALWTASGRVVSPLSRLVGADQVDETLVVGAAVVERAHPPVGRVGQQHTGRAAGVGRFRAGDPGRGSGDQGSERDDEPADLHGDLLGTGSRR